MKPIIKHRIFDPLTRWLPSRWLSVAVSATVAGGFALALLRFAVALAVTLRDGSFYSAYGFTEFLINFQGGFVRRGLLGQLLYQLHTATGLNVTAMVLTLCFGAALFTVGFFLRQFARRGYCWWLLLSPLFCGFLTCIVRKDFLLYALLIGSIYLLRQRKALAATLLTIVGLFLHEAYLFWGAPLVALLLWAQSRWRGYAAGVLFVGVFALLSAFKGDVVTALAINDSWDALQLFPPLSNASGSIAALGWDADYAMEFHLAKNFTYQGERVALFYRPLTYLLAYYLFTNFIFAFGAPPHSERDRVHLSALYLLVSLTLLPMWVCLSCDYARLYQYVAVSAFATFLILPSATLAAALPHWLQRAAERLNSTLRAIVPPTRGLLLLLLLFLAEMPCYFDPYGVLKISLAGRWFALLAGL